MLTVAFCPVNLPRIWKQSAAYANVSLTMLELVDGHRPRSAMGQAPAFEFHYPAKPGTVPSSLLFTAKCVPA
jgi:hypothetical protein